jgi:hypothetical protein
MTDPWLSRAQRNDATWVELNDALRIGTEAAIAEVLAKLWRSILGERVQLSAAARRPDFDGAEQAARETWRQALNRWVRPIAYAYWRRQYAEQPGDGSASVEPIDRWWAVTIDRLEDTSERIVEAVREEVRSRPTASIPELRDVVARVLGLDATTRAIRDRIEGIEARLAAGRENESRFARRVQLQAELFRVQASRTRSRAYSTLAGLLPDEADQFRELARQSARSEGDEQRIERMLADLDDEIYAGTTLDEAERTELLQRRRELYEEAAADSETWRNRATVAARTLSTDVLNEATLQRAEDVSRESGVELVKVWLAADGGHSPRSRPSHRAAHGQVVDLHAKFRVGEEEMDRPGDPDASLDETIECRCSVSYLTRAEHEEIAAVLTAAAMEDGMTETALEDLPPVMWHGVIAVEGVYTGDRRRFAPGALRTQPLPMPIRFQREDWGGHTGAVVVANMEAARRFSGQIRAWGTFADGTLTPEVDEVQGLMATRMMRGVSVDGDDVLDSQFVVEVDAEGNVFENFESMRLRSSTFVAIPAFDEAEVFLGPPPAEWLLEGEPLAVEQNDPDTAPVNLDDMFDSVLAASRVPENLAEYWTTGEGAAKIRWGTSGDFERCRRALAEYVSPGQLSGMCANLHHRATGKWPGEQAALMASIGTDEAIADLYIGTEKSGWGRPFIESDFRMRELTEPTPITITDDGEVYGHLAVWGTCHTGFSDMCVMPPQSKIDYALFHTGAVRLDDGRDLPVGKLTVGAGHANGKLAAQPAAAHYDNSAFAASVVRAYDDPIGIQLSGRIIPGCPEDKVEELRRSPLSGDWRAYQGNLELIAALGVNTPGFPVLRTMVASVNGRQVSLIAAGALQPTPEDRIAKLATRMRVAELAKRINSTGGK